jgi:multidrug efflux pump
MFSRFFIDRPIFATVLSIVITLAGAIALTRLPLAQYPQVTPPAVRVSCSYPGASAQVVAETVAAPIEQQVIGVENMLYMASQCANDGSYSLEVTFKQGVNLDMAQVLVQNRVNLALPMLPNVIKQTGVTTRRRSPDILMSVNINSPDDRYDQLFLSNYALLHLRDELLRLPGVSDIFISGQRDYSMRIWLDPDRLAARNLTAGDVVRAIREQNQEIASGQIGQPPVRPGQEVQLTLSTLGRLKTPAQFGDIVLRTTRDGRVLRIKDVGCVELGAKNQDVSCRLDGKPSVGLIFFQLPDANALEVAERVRAKMDELAKSFPEGLIYEIQYDTTPYTRQCIEEVFKSLRAAVLLVALVVLLFLQNWRSAVIPLLAVPVAIIGTFAVMAAFHFSLNNLTLFGLVLAIGIVVDDAIVVVEAVEHHIEHGLAPRDAAIKAMSQVSSPVVAVGLVLSAVFVPCAFIGGITGQFFRQFALTISASTIISTFNSLTLSPALAALLLRPRSRGVPEVLPRLFYAVVGGWLAYGRLGPWLASRGMGGIAVPADWATAAAAAAPWIAATAGAVAGWVVSWPVNFVLGRLLRLFDRGFRFATSVYTRVVGMLVRVSVVVLVVYGGLLLLTYRGFVTTPKGFIPSADMGILMVSVQLPDAASTERTRQVMERVQEICLGTKTLHEIRGIPLPENAKQVEPVRGIRHTMAVTGTSMVLNVSGSFFGFMFVILDDFANREQPGLSAEEIAAQLRARCQNEIPEAMVTVLPPPPVRGVGRTGGFKLMIEDRGDLGPTMLQRQTDEVAEAGRRHRSARGRPELTIAPNVFRANAPQLFVDMNRAQCMTSGVRLGDAFDTLQVYLGSLYVNDFNLFGRTWQVVVQADARSRNQVNEVRQLKVRNAAGAMVPIGTIADVRQINGPLVLTRFNTYPAAAIQGTPMPGVSSRQAIDLMEETARRELLPTMHYEWTELAYLELQAGHTAMVIFALAVVMVFLVLAAQYESWSLPLAVILVVPICLLAAITGVTAVPAALRWFHQLPQLLAGVPAGPGVVRGAGPGAVADINIFTQIGFVVLVGLASKNAILIVEFAKRQRADGVPRREAAMAACQLRLRPIVMTSFAFILGVFPLLIGRGAGAEMRRNLGTAVFSGMLGVTLFGIFLTPVFFAVVDWLGGTRLFAPRWFRGAGRILLWVLWILFFGWAVWIVIHVIHELRRRRVPTGPQNELLGDDAQSVDLERGLQDASTKRADAETPGAGDAERGEPTNVNEVTPTLDNGPPTNSPPTTDL